MSWILLIIGGLFEVAFATCLGKAKEATGVESAYWMMGCLFNLPLIYILF